MALTTPILYTQVAFDAQNEQVFKFYVISGSQVVSNILTIKNNATLATVYEQEQITYKFEHTVPANTLSNGTYYQAYITTKDAQGNISPISNTIQFYCYTQPTLEFSNMPISGVIENSSFSFNVTYNQIQGETLNSYVFNLYDVSGAVIATSGTKYNSGTILPLTVSYLFSGFDDNSQYYIEFNGITAEGTQITTGKVAFTVKYTKPAAYSYLFLTNNCQGGYITVQSNVVGIDGVSQPDPPKYVDDNTAVDLTDKDAYVEWVEGYVLPRDWTLGLWGKTYTPNTDIFSFSNTNGDTIIVYYCVDEVRDKAWFYMRAHNEGAQYGYIIQTDEIARPADDETVFLWLRAINNIYEIKIENRGVSA